MLIRTLLLQVRCMLQKILYFWVSITAFSNSNLLTDFGYTAGYKNLLQKPGEKSHLFSKFLKIFL